MNDYRLSHLLIWGFFGAVISIAPLTAAKLFQHVAKEYQSAMSQIAQAD